MATRLEKDPLTVFCRLCRELGYELYEMDLVSAGEDFYATMRRSTNGGGENSPKLEGEDDFYELLMARPWRQQRKQNRFAQIDINYKCFR